MKQLRFLVIVMLFASCVFYTKAHSFSKKLDWVEHVGYREFDFKTDTFNVLKYEACNSGIFSATKAIQNAIDKCAENGGGVVYFPKGYYLTGSIYVKSNVHLYFHNDVVLLGSTELVDYPEIDTRVAGIEIKWPSALININNAKNVKISGEAEIQGRGRIFWAKFIYMKPIYQKENLKWIRDYDCKRPRMLVSNNSTNVKIQDITLKESPFWTVQILYSKQVTVDGISIDNFSKHYAPSTDGIDIDSSEKVLVQNCNVACMDDNFCLKAGRDADGLRVNKPCQYIVIRNNKTAEGSGLVVFGSETSGGIKYVYVSNMEANGTDTGIRFKSARTRGGVIENVYIENITMKNIPTVFEMSMNWNPKYSYCKLPEKYNGYPIPKRWKMLLQKVTPAEKGFCKLQNIYFKNITAEKCKRAFKVQGYKEYPVEGLSFDNVNIQAQTGGSIENARNWKMSDSKFEFEKENSLKQKNTSGIRVR
ncbi:glycoside hydrolase family 28 protein [Prolixibacteraceae bacterium JC049]|nr:glycoside hydrolase family 28 protein [Prolixibacteraceae bacterium JC049]